MTPVSGVDCVFHVAFIMHVMQWHLALHMHGNIALNGCDCMVGKINIMFGV